ncbi:MAG: lamin tail domain-containing protein, partial [Bacteroidetes bacterium]|nr:lamin tail domain-containing protein [Bacteroidota bacterium]
MKKYIYILLFISLFFVTQNLSAQLFINEYSCANTIQFADNNTKYEDWIEIYNDGNAAVSLQDYYLSDDITDKVKYKIPSGITIASKGFVRFWASGRNMITGGHYHTNFHLTQSKTNADWIVLSDANGNILDKVQIIRHQLGHSVGRKPNGGSTWGIFTSPTINASNTATQYTRYAAKPTASAPAGYYNTTFTLYLTTNEPNSKIYYTIDGKVPTISSKQYSAAAGIKIDSTKVIKAITVSNNATVLKSFTEINTYFYKVNHTMPVISIAGTNLDVLANGDNTIRPEGSFEFFNKDKKRTATSYGSYNSHGQDSWANDQRSLDFKSFDEMGYNYAIQEQLFTLSDRPEFQGIILRAAGDDNYPAAHHAGNAGSAHIRDAYVQNLAKQGNLKVDLRTAEKAIVYLNGKYWGVYDMRERADEHDYTKYYYDQDKYNLQYILTWGTTWAEYGGSQAITDWSNLRSFVMNKNMAVDSNFKYVTDRLDVYSLVDYVIVNSVSVCSDWLNYNTGWWRGLNKKGGHQKWGYTLWDNDATFGFYINYTGIPDTGSSAPVCNVENSGLSDPEGHIDLLLKLCQNKAFNQYYKSRYIDLANTVFSSKNMLSKLDSTINLLKPEMTMHAKRWFGTYNEWMTNANKLRNFVAKRCSLMNNGINSCYGFTGPYKTTFQVFPKGSADIQINSLRIDTFPFTGNYHGKVDVLIKAIPHKDYLFDYWVVRKDTIKPDTITWDAVLRIAGVDTIYSYFKKRTSVAQLNISEINYGNDVTRNSGTWFELTNYGNSDIDISHWKIKSGVKWKEHELSDNSIISAHSKWLFVSDSAKFHSLYGAKNNVVYLTFDLEANNEAIYIYDTINTQMLYVPFKSKQPWPIAANKAGRTLELLNDTLDASNPLSWRNGCIGGSPGDVYTACNEFVQVAEINYNSYPAANAGDWFELYNQHTDTIDLTGYTFRTDKFYNAYPVTGSLKIAPGKRAVICEDTVTFLKVYPHVTSLYMLAGLKLSNAGDQIKIYNSNDSIIYSVAYEDTLLFTQKADGFGYTLDYNYKGDDYSDGRNWSATCFGGSPGDSTGSCESGILFTEVNYKSALFNDAGDWFEIKNTSNTDYNIYGWNFSDSSAGGFTISQNYILKANSYLVLVADTVKFKTQYPNVTNYIGNLNFNLSSGGDKIRILNASNK